MFTTATHRPRNVDAKRAGAILYGDWGTSKAYVIGLAFALAGYASFWLIAAVSILSILVGINYITVCKHYPFGGGVYASVRRRSPVLAMIGAFFLMADYLVTAALSALSAAFYFGIGDPILFSCAAILLIGVFNFFGPRHVGTFAFVLVIFAFITLCLLAFLTLPHLKTAWEHIHPLTGSPLTIWQQFVGVIVALSGIEAIANTTRVMTLDAGSTLERPSVKKTARKAILPVMLEVVLFTSLFAFAMAALSGFEFSQGTVNAPGNPNVRDYMLKYMGQIFGTAAFGSYFGHAFALLISVVIGLLLLSAVNTAITGLVSLQYLMAGDGEVPRSFQKVNHYGVPLIPLLIATVFPVILVVAVQDVEKMAALYAIGFVGAIATNLGSTSTDKTVALTMPERVFMFLTFLVMAAIEITLFIDKPHARIYVLVIIALGLVLRAFTEERKKKIIQTPPQKEEPIVIPTQSLLFAGKKGGRALNLAIEKSIKRNMPLHVLFVREQSVIADNDNKRALDADRAAIKMREFVEKRANPQLTFMHYAVTDSMADIVIAYAMRYDATEIYVPLPKKGVGLQLLKGNMIRDLSEMLPQNMHLFVIP